MERQYVTIGGKDYPVINDGVLIGSWEDIPKSDGKRVSTITKDENDSDLLDGLIIRGYETKFGKVNNNFEVYEKDCLDKFINDYFVGNKLNMPVDIEHSGDYCGKVLYVEVNTTGFYFVAYVPREDNPQFAWIKSRLKNGIIQGFSKFGWATDYEFKYDEDGYFSHEVIREMNIVAMSLVATPANGIPFEKMQEIKNGLRFVNKAVKDNAESDPLKAMFNS